MIIYIESVEIRSDRRGKAYLSMIARVRNQDQTDVVRMPAKCWAGNFSLCDPPIAGFRYNVDGSLQIYQGDAQLVVDCFNEKAGEGPGDFVEHPAVEPESTYRYLYCGKWNDPYLDKLFSELHDALGSTFRSGRSLLEILFEIPAGASYHHNRRAGLLQHVLEMVCLADALWAGNLDFNWDREVLKAGILLHDLGKVYEYSPNTYQFESTDVGERFGHTCWLPSFVASIVGDCAFQGKIADVLHCVLSHHGTDGGAPVPPKTLEAILLNLIDQMSAKLDVCRSAQEAVFRGEKTKYSPMLKTTPLCLPKLPANELPAV